MFLMGFFLGLAVGLGFWVWQQVHLSLYLEQLLQPLNSHSRKITNIKLLLRPPLTAGSFHGKQTATEFAAIIIHV